MILSFTFIDVFPFCVHWQQKVKSFEIDYTVLPFLNQLTYCGNKTLRSHDLVATWNMSNCEKSTQSPVVVTECTNKSAGEMERPNTDPPQSSYRNLGQLQGPLAIFWDIENCPVPTDVWPEDLGSNIRMALQEDRVTSGTTITTFSAYGDFSSFPKKLREGCQRTGVKLVDVPNGHKDAADKAIMLDMLLFAMDNRPPSTIMLISGDVDFAPTLHVLNQRGYTVILTIRAAAYTSSALINAGQFVWDWPSLARGKGFQSPFEPSPPPSRAPELSGHSIRYQMNEKIHSVVQADPMVFNEGSGPPSLFECTKSYFNPNAEAGHSGAYLAETSARIHISENQSNFPWLQPSILNGIKTRLVNLLEVSGHMLPVAQIQAEHLKFYGYPLFISDYGARCLIPFLEQMPDTFLIGGKDDNRIVYLPWAIGKKGMHFPNQMPCETMTKKQRKEMMQSTTHKVMTRKQRKEMMQALRNANAMPY